MFHWKATFHLEAYDLKFLYPIQNQVISLKIYIWDALRDLAPFAQFQKRKKTHGRVIRSVNLHAEACNFTKSNNPPWLVFMFLILYKW